MQDIQDDTPDKARTVDLGPSGASPSRHIIDVIVEGPAYFKYSDTSFSMSHSSIGVTLEELRLLKPDAKMRLHFRSYFSECLQAQLLDAEAATLPKSAHRVTFTAERLTGVRGVRHVDHDTYFDVHFLWNTKRDALFRMFTELEPKSWVELSGWLTPDNAFFADSITLLEKEERHTIQVTQNRRDTFTFKGTMYDMDLGVGMSKSELDILDPDAKMRYVFRAYVSKTMRPGYKDCRFAELLDGSSWGKLSPEQSVFNGAKRKDRVFFSANSQNQTRYYEVAFNWHPNRAKLFQKWDMLADSTPVKLTAQEEGFTLWVTEIEPCEFLASSEEKQETVAKKHTAAPNAKYDAGFAQADYMSLSPADAMTAMQTLEVYAKEEVAKPRLTRSVTIGDDKTFTALHKILTFIAAQQHKPLPDVNVSLYRTRTGIIFESLSGTRILSPWGGFVFSYVFDGVVKALKLKYTDGPEDSKRCYIDECDGVKLASSPDFPIRRDLWQDGMRTLMEHDWKERCAALGTPALPEPTPRDIDMWTPEKSLEQLQLADYLVCNAAQRARVQELLCMAIRAAQNRPFYYCNRYADEGSGQLLLTNILSNACIGVRDPDKPVVEGRRSDEYHSELHRDMRSGLALQLSNLEKCLAQYLVEFEKSQCTDDRYLVILLSEREFYRPQDVAQSEAKQKASRTDFQFQVTSVYGKNEIKPVPEGENDLSPFVKILEALPEADFIAYGSLSSGTSVKILRVARTVKSGAVPDATVEAMMKRMRTCMMMNHMFADDLWTCELYREDIKNGVMRPTRLCTVKG